MAGFASQSNKRLNIKCIDYTEIFVTSVNRHKKIKPWNFVRVWGVPK